MSIESILRVPCKIFLAFLFAGILVTAQSCIRTRVADFTVLSTKNVPLGFKSVGQGEGRDDHYLITIVPVGFPVGFEPSLSAATDQAIESQKGGQLLQDARLQYRWYYLPGVFGHAWEVVSGDVVDSWTARAGGAMPTATSQVKAKVEVSAAAGMISITNLNNHGWVEITVSVTPVPGGPVYSKSFDELQAGQRHSIPIQYFSTRDGAILSLNSIKTAPQVKININSFARSK